MQRYKLIEEVKQDDAQVFGIVVGTVVVNQYMDLISRIKDVLTRSNKKCYEVLIGKLNEPKLKNLAIVDMYVLVGCRETSLIDSKEFMARVVTPHELFMALIPSVFPWECKIITDFRVLLQRFEQDKVQLEEKADADLEEYKLSTEEQQD